MGGPMDQRVTVSGNISGSHDSATATPVEGSVTESPTDLNKSGLSFLGPTSYAKLVTNESSRKSVNFRTLITLAQNRVDVTVPLESIRAVSEQFADSAYGFFFGKAGGLPQDVGNVLVWVKLHGVPLTEFSEDGLSVIAIKLGTPLMLTLIHLTCACNHGVDQVMLEQ
ncbi:hypothetical protein Tco_0792703 [Tanacetum coccineum]